jgi:hypothetical protein
MAPKKIHENALRGQLGISLIETRVLKMGYVWYPTGGLEAGIDGLIEIRDPATGAVLNSIVQVQSKATANPFLKETPASFEYICDERDIEYWLGGNTPVILIVSRPSTDEAYWVHVQKYFADLSARKSRRVVFDKQRDRFDESCADALKCLAAPRSLGLYSSPIPKSERLYSNLLSVASYAPTLYLAQTHHRFGSALRAELQAAGLHDATEWVLREGSVLSFHDLTESPWPQLCDRGTVEEFDTDDWALSDDPDRQRTFVWLLNEALRQFVATDLQYSRSHDAYYFHATSDLSNRVFSYQSLAQQTSRIVFRGYPSKKDPDGEMARGRGILYPL